MPSCIKNRFRLYCMYFYTTTWKKTEYMNRKIQNVVKRPKLIMKSDQMLQPKPWTMKIKPHVQARWLLQWNVCVAVTKYPQKNDHVHATSRQSVCSHDGMVTIHMCTTLFLNTLFLSHWHDLCLIWLACSVGEQFDDLAVQLSISSCWPPYPAARTSRGLL